MTKIIDCFPFYPSLYFVNVIETSSVYFMATLSDQFGPKQMDMQLWIHFFVIYFLTNTAKGMTPRD